MPRTVQEGAHTVAGQGGRRQGNDADVRPVDELELAGNHALSAKPTTPVLPGRSHRGDAAVAWGDAAGTAGPVGAAAALSEGQSFACLVFVDLLALCAGFFTFQSDAVCSRTAAT